ncbi:MAG: protein kinase [Deltaproteobacteria bacterium]|nr:protein kinase [Deltaproteobacteria bacterium]
MGNPDSGHRTATAWVCGQKILASFTVNDIRSGPLHTDYLLSHPGWQGRVTIRTPHAKLIRSQEDVELFRTGIQQWVRLGMHPHVEACHGLVDDSGVAFFVEDILGASLTNWLKSNKCNLRTVLSLLIQICHGLEYLHAHGMHHQGLTPDRIYITRNSLAKIREIIRPVAWQGRKPNVAGEIADIRAMGDLLRMMIRAQPKEPEAGQDTFGRDFRGHAPLLRSVLAKCAPSVTAGYRHISVLRHDLNNMYQQVYGLACPYDMIETACRAESLNNQAVFLFETGRYRQGMLKLRQSLLVKDRLAEAVYNLILFKLRSGLFPAWRIQLMIEAALRDGPTDDHLSLLKQALPLIKKEGRQKISGLPPFLLCPPADSLRFYRQAKKKQQNRQDIESHFLRLRYEACLKSLLCSWKEVKFAKDPFFSRIYDRLLARADKREIVGVQRYATFKGHGQAVQHLSYLPGTRKIIQSSGGDNLLIHDYGAGMKVSTLKTGGGAVSALAVSPDGKMIVAGTTAGEIDFWQSRSGNTLRRAHPHAERINAIAFSEDGRFLASGGADGKVIVRSVATNREKIIPAWDNHQVTALAFLPGGTDLVAGSSAGEIKLWSSRGKKCLHALAAHASPVVSLATSLKGDFFVSSGGEEIKIWDSRTGGCLRQMAGHPGGTTRVLLLQDNHHLVSAGMDDMIRIRDLNSGEVALTLDGRENGICCLAGGTQPHFFMAGQQSGALLIWKIIYNLIFS